MLCMVQRDDIFLFSHISTPSPFPAPFHSSTLHVNVSLAHLMDVFCTLQVLVKTNRRLLRTSTLVCVWYFKNLWCLLECWQWLCVPTSFFWGMWKKTVEQLDFGFDVIFSSFFLLCAERFASYIRNVAMPYHHHDSVYFIILCLISILIIFIYFQSLIIFLFLMIFSRFIIYPRLPYNFPLIPIRKTTLSAPF